MSGWIGIDLDGTLAVYDGWRGIEHIGAPVPTMVDVVKKLRAAGLEVRIVTARVSIAADMSDPENLPKAEVVRNLIEDWCLEHIGETLPITCVKDFGMIALFDDRCIAVHPNTGEFEIPSGHGFDLLEVLL